MTPNCSHDDSLNRVSNEKEGPGISKKKCPKAHLIHLALSAIPSPGPVTLPLPIALAREGPAPNESSTRLD
jgi:hypothetical protein